MQFLLQQVREEGYIMVSHYPVLSSENLFIWSLEYPTELGWFTYGLFNFFLSASLQRRSCVCLTLVK